MKDRCQKRYSVYDSKTEMPLIIYGTSKECAKAMGVTLNSFYRYLIRVREGKIKLHKWLVYEDEVEELEEEAEVQETAAAPTVDENAELKPCPFCGAGAFVDVYMDTEYINVHHDPMCMVKPTTWVSAYGDGLPLKFQVKAWNRRAEDGK